MKSSRASSWTAGAMQDERHIWLTLPQGEPPEGDARISSLLKEGWVIDASQKRVLTSNTSDRQLWVVHLKKIEKNGSG